MSAIQIQLKPSGCAIPLSSAPDERIAGVVANTQAKLNWLVTLIDALSGDKSRTEHEVKRLRAVSNVKRSSSQLFGKILADLATMIAKYPATLVQACRRNEPELDSRLHTSAKGLHAVAGAIDSGERS